MASLGSSGSAGSFLGLRTFEVTTNFARDDNLASISSIVQNHASPIFWWVLFAIAFISTVVNLIIYQRTRRGNSDRRNFRLRSSIYLTFAWAALCIAHLAIG
jgi:hypothetical protein